MGLGGLETPILPGRVDWVKVELLPLQPPPAVFRVFFWKASGTGGVRCDLKADLKNICFWNTKGAGKSEVNGAL